MKTHDRDVHSSDPLILINKYTVNKKYIEADTLGEYTEALLSEFWFDQRPTFCSVLDPKTLFLLLVGRVKTSRHC
jgi:hypothetical protein